MKPDFETVSVGQVRSRDEWLRDRTKELSAAVVALILSHAPNSKIYQVWNEMSYVCGLMRESLPEDRN